MGNDDLLGGTNADDGFFGGDDEGTDLFGESIPPAPQSEPSEPVATDSPAGMSTVTATAPAAKPQQDGYVVLARKYRPQTFDDIVGQESVQKALRGAIATGQISHSYLFSGPRGTGKTSTARILAKALNCQENGPRPDPCGKCSSCRSITAGSSLDVIEIDAASNTGVDNIRELKSGVVLAPFSRYKVYIVDEVHMLSNQAFNALLKTLEEPPPQVIFILATTELHKVPETIISRCQTFMFKRFSLEELKNQLGNILDIETKQRGLSVTPEDREKILDLVSRNAEGGMRDAQVTLDQVLVLSKGAVDFESVRRFLGMADAVALDSFVQLLNDRKSRELLELIDSLVAEGQDLELFVKGACEHMRDLLLIQCAGRDTSLINVSQDRALELESFANRLAPAFLVNAIDHFLKVVGEMKTSGQPRTILELAVLKLTLADEDDKIRGILNRLDALESGAGAAGAQIATPAASSVAGTNVRLQAEETMAAPTQIMAAPVQPEMQAAVEETASAYESHVDVAIETPAAQVPNEVAKSADGIVTALRNRLKQDASMLSMSFEKVVSGHRLDGRTLVLELNAGLQMACAQLMRPHPTAQLTALLKEVGGENLSLRFESVETNTPPPAPANPDPAQAKPASAPAPEPSPPPANTTDASIATTPAASDASPPDEATDRELKIYYPEEIREKTMIELKAAEFQKLLTVDEKLKELVEKTREVFGVDDSRMKFHRSTLA